MIVRHSIYNSKIFNKIIFWLSKNWIWLIFLFLALILPIIWFSTNFLYAPEEILFTNYQIIFDKFLFSWGDKLNYGTPASPEIASLVFPNAIFYKLLSAIGLNNHIIQILYLQFFIFITFLSISYFLKIFTSEKRIIFIGSLVYFFNFYTYQTFAYSAKMSQMILCPLFFYLLYRYLQTKNYIYIAINFIVFFIFQNIFTNLPQVASTIMVYFIAIAYFIFTEKYNLKYFLIKYTKKIVLFFTFLLPIALYHALIYYFSIIENMDKIGKLFGFSAITSPLHLIFQLRGSWWEYGGDSGVSYNHWLLFYDNWLIIFAAFFIFFIAFLPMLYKKINKAYLFWIVVFLVSIFLTSGSIFIPDLFLLIYKNIPFFYIFREPWAKFMPFVILSFSVIIVIIFNLNRKINKKIFYIFLFLILIRSLNFFSPNFFDHSNAKWKKIFIKPPAYWDEYFNWTKKNTEKYVLNMPFFDSENKGFKYNWYDQDPGNSNVSINFIFDQSNAIREKPSYSRISKFNDVAQYFDKIHSLDFIKLGTVDYLLKQDDFVVIGKKENEMGLESIGKYFEEKPEYSFDKLSLYKIKSEYYTPHIFIPNSTFTINRNIDYLSKTVSNKSYDFKSVVFIKNQNTLKESLINEIKNYSKNNKLTLEFKKINPTKYEVKIKNASDTFPVVFLENFNHWWKFYLVKNNSNNKNIFETLLKKPIDDNSHTIVNGYANSWIIQTEKICDNNKNCAKNLDGTYNIDAIIEFWPQRLFYIVFFFSGMTLLACFGHLGYSFYKKKYAAKN